MSRAIPENSGGGRPLLVLACLGLLLAGCARAGVVSMRSPHGTPPSVMVPASVAPPLQAVPLNERLEYAIHWWGLPVGYAELTTFAAEKKENAGLIRLRFEARSNWYIRALYPVRAELTSYVDPATRSPRRSWSYLKRQWRLHESALTFNPETGICLHRLPDDRKVEVPVTPTTQDGLSMLYYVRTMPLELGKTIPLTITADGRNWDLKAQVVRASMVRIGSLGDWPAVEGRLELAYPVPFFHGANARVWLSADDQRIPLMAKIRSRIGPVTVVLVRRRAGG